MELIFVTLIIVLGFSYIFYLQQKHLYKLEQMLKAKDLTEYKVLERNEKVEAVPLEEPEDLQDFMRNKKPEEVREVFNKRP